MSAQRIPFERQRQMWIDFYHQYPDAEWAEQCQQQIVRIDRIIDFERAALDTPSPSPDPVATMPAGPYAERRFMWLGDRRDIRIDVLRDGITRLAKAGCIRPEREQQDAMRRGLGVDLNDSERHSGIPWVYWLADDAQLHFLIASLWDMGLIHAAGGESAKWPTLCGLFLHPDGSRHTLKIRTNRCKNPRKRKVISDAILDGLGFVSRGS